MKNKIYSRLTILFACIILTGMLLVSCNEDPADTDSVQLYSFGPSPVLRGNDIRFIGQNLNMVTSVILPNDIEITDIDVVSSTEIRVTVPQNAEPGYVTLNYKEGSITTKTRLGFTEPYEITSISPVGEAIREGDEVTISGDYLNNIVAVVFYRSVSVDSSLFISQSREEIVLAVPKEASSGKIIVKDEAGNQLYSTGELTISQPSFDSFNSSEIKAGHNLTVNGENLDLVESIVFEGGSSAGHSAFVSMDEGSIVVTTPADIQDGPITLVAYSGEKIVSSESITAVVPSNLVISAETSYKAGLNVMITGANLDLVTSVAFAGASEITDFDYVDTDPDNALGKITIAIPEAATDGLVTLKMASTKTVETSAITLVKPQVISMGTTNMISGNNLDINGTDLDLVASVSVGGESATIVDQSETAMTIFVPYSVSGSASIVFTNSNGSDIDAATVNVTETSLAYITKMPTSCTPGVTLTIEGRNFGSLTEVTIGGKSTEFAASSSGNTLFLVVASNTSIGIQDLKLTTAEGSTTESLKVTNSGPDPILSTTVMVNDFEEHGGHNGYWDNSWSGITEILNEDGNTFLRVNAAATGEAWIINCNHQSSGALGPVIENIENYVLKLDLRIEEGVTGADEAALQVILGDSWKWFGTGLLPASSGGEWMTISIPVSKWELTGTLDLSNGTNGLYGGPIPAGISFDNLRFDLK